VGEVVAERDVPQWIQTHTGLSAYPLDIKKEQINILDIAHALGHQCRFSGHCAWFYSVAQHSYYVSVIVQMLGGTPLDQLCGLLHDASEAYLVDLPTPVKCQVVGYKEAEHKVMNVICDAFQIPPPEYSSPGYVTGSGWDLVKKADAIALATEARDLMGNPQTWRLEESPVDWKIDRWKINDSRAVFRMQYHALLEQVTGGAESRYWVDRVKQVSGRFDPRLQKKIDNPLEARP